MDPPGDRRWCYGEAETSHGEAGHSESESEGGKGFIDCDEEYEKGVTFRPVPGNAIYWENLLPNGRGDERTLHAGLPLTGGGKVGMNIWTREMALPEGVRGVDFYP